jgi:hypothetical protein
VPSSLIRMEHQSPFWFLTVGGAGATGAGRVVGGSRGNQGGRRYGRFNSLTQPRIGQQAYEGGIGRPRVTERGPSCRAIRQLCNWVRSQPNRPLSSADQITVAQALYKLLECVEKTHQVKKAAVLRKADIGSEGDSTKHLAQYAIPEGGIPRDCVRKSPLT